MARNENGMIKGIVGIGFLFVGTYMFFIGLGMMLGATLNSFFPSILSIFAPSLFQQMQQMILASGAFATLIGGIMGLVGLKWTLANETGLIKMMLLGIGIVLVILGALVFVAGGWAAVLCGLILIGISTAFIQRGAGINVIPWVNKWINVVRPLLTAIPV